MAFTLTATVGSTTLTLNNGAPFTVRRISSLGGVPVRRVTAQGPAQDGDTDLGYRLDSRKFELVLGFKATTDAILDGYRDQLTSLFKPLTSTVLTLKATRDDGELRAVDCYTRGKIDIALAKELRPGHYHEATIPLYAPFPAWYEVAPGTVTITGSGGTAADWYLAGGAIGTAQVLMSGTTPAQGALWTYSGSIPHTTSYTLAFRSTPETLGSVNKYAFYVDNSAVEQDITFIAGSVLEDPARPNYYAYLDPAYYALGASWMTAGTGNYFVRHNATGLDFGDTTYPEYVDMYMQGAVASRVVNYSPGFSRPLGGTARRWRSDATNTAASRWAGTIGLYALYSPGLTYSQIVTLDAYMTGGVGGTANQVVAIPYEGDLPEYPVITIRGPISAPNIQNLTTGEVLNFGTNTIGAGTTYVIDTRPGIKTVLQGTTNKRGELTSNSDVDTFHIQPNFTTNYNNLSLTGVSTSGSTQLTVVYYNRFSSY